MNYDRFFADALLRFARSSATASLRISSASADQLSDRAQGTERLRITPTPLHDDRLVRSLTEALISVWRQLGLPLTSTARAAAHAPVRAIKQRPSCGPRSSHKRLPS